MKVLRPLAHRIYNPAPSSPRPASTAVIRAFVRTLERLGPSAKPEREGSR